jgi:hypothetical protein
VSVICKICGCTSFGIFTIKVLRKFDVDYYKCGKCGFIQTQEPFWLEEAYSSAITSLDIGLIYRNLQNKPIVETTIKYLFDRRKKFIDYGGGYGMFVRIMRDAGLNYYRQDIYCENIFAKRFDVSDLKENGEKFELLTAFEVFEHLLDPIEEFKKMLSYSDSIFFTTSIYPTSTDLTKWWYLIPETGQHISLYSEESLIYLATMFGMCYYRHNDFHLITKAKFPKSKFERIFNNFFRIVYNRFNKMESLLQKDFNEISGIKM